MSDFASWLLYHCHSCHEVCFNPVTDSCTRYRECRGCHSVPVLERGEPVDQIEPDLRWATRVGLAEA
ncbi:hypothetical protein GCM10009019_12620 [Salarchaeum japonicum]|uniref:Uncharacterized protein n=1 Tax=Salarchaeum japonicum TaxID=555573 RepID=A0AAV3T0R4_9EURY